MKIAIIGYSGSGKSTLAAYLSKVYSLPLLHLDKVHFLPGWQIRPTEEKEALVSNFLNQNDAWVIDGNYTKLSYARRMEEADTIIFMNFNRISCFCRAYSRFRKYKGKTRASITEGCDEKFDREFMLWILRNGRSEKHKNNYENICKTYPNKVVILRNQRELTAYMQKIDC